MMTPARLPDGRHIALGADVVELLHCGLLVAESVQVGSAPELTRETAACAEQLRQQYSGKLPSQITPLQEARRLYRAAGMEPTRHRPSSEALLRRVLKGKSLYVINNAVDACNLASLQFLLPIGLYDLAQVAGDVTLRLGQEGEEYAGIRKGAVHLTERLGLFDRVGPFGSPTSDSARTCVTEATRSVLAVIMATRSYPDSAMQDNLELLADLYRRHCQARVTYRGSLRGMGATS
jgi:DNA/RNA-binding domain of Phe-tRNA-synthetase-like protein